VDAWFTPYYSDHLHHLVLTKLGFVEPAINGYRRRGICADELNAQGLRSTSVPSGTSTTSGSVPTTRSSPRASRPLPGSWSRRASWSSPTAHVGLAAYPLMPRPLATHRHLRADQALHPFCVASEGYRKQFLAEGSSRRSWWSPAIPNFDDFARFSDNDFPHRGYVLVCTSDGARR
jgi:hypothetical protein